MTIYTPAPEAGLICSKCWRPDGRAGQFGEEYTWHWTRGVDNRLAVAPVPSVVPVSRRRDRMLNVAEVATRLGVSTTRVRRLDNEGQLAPDSRDGINGGRLYSVERIDAIDPATIERWRANCRSDTEEKLLKVGEVGALLGVSSSKVRELVEAGMLVAKRFRAGGHLYFRQGDVNQFDRSKLGDFSLQPIGEAAKAVGLTVDTLRRLVSQKQIASARTVGRQLHFDVALLRSELGALGLATRDDGGA